MKAHESQSREFLKNKPLWEYIKTFEKYKERLDFRYYVRGGLFRTFYGVKCLKQVYFYTFLNNCLAYLISFCFLQASCLFRHSSTY